jgi:hypothetical protein
VNFEDWEDPNPAPVIDDIKLEDGRVIHVVRDDLIDGGSKVRFVDFMIRNLEEKEVVFGGCPATGYAQMALPLVCKKYGKKATLFMAKRDPSKYTEYQKKALKFGANIEWVNMGMLTVTLSRARKYYEADKNNRFNLPLGLEHPSVVESIVKVCRNLDIKPTEIWSVGSSGTINRGMQNAWPDIPSNVIQVGHNMTEREIGRSKLYKSEYKFDKKVKDEEMPPFPSAPTYDAKGWKFVSQYAKDGSIFWNVGA